MAHGPEHRRYHAAPQLDYGCPVRRWRRPWSHSVLKTDSPRPRRGPRAASVDQEIGAIRSLQESGRAAEAGSRLQALVEVYGGRAWFWAALARSHQAQGDTSAELEAIECGLALDPGRERLRLRAAAILSDRGDIPGAVVHYQILSDANPDQPKLAIRLARLCQKLGDDAAGAAAWTRVLPAFPNHPEAHARMAELHERGGRLAEAAAHISQSARAAPHKVRIWLRLAHVAEAAGDLAQAKAAWERVAELRPDGTAASDWLTEHRLWREISASGHAAPGFRLAVLGNCQAIVLARCLRALHPDAQIVAVSWQQLRSPGLIARAKATIGELDAVVTQPLILPGLEAFSPAALKQGTQRCVMFPGVHFTGFQPDAVRVIANGLESLIGEWHSALIMAAYRMGLPQARAGELFNAYVYGALGYFDEYAKAQTFLQRAAKQIGWDLAAELKTWPRPFVHTPTHPRIEVMMDIARGVCGGLGGETAPDAAAPPDPFVASGAWPIYPEIGKRLGLAGEMTFVSPKQRVTLDLEGAIAWYYAAYAKVPAEVLAAPRVDKVIAQLQAEGV